MRFRSKFTLCRLGRGKTYEVENPQIKNESKNSAVESTVSEYVQKSTIHGVAYVGDDERNKFERIWWLVMLVCSIFGACYLIYQAYRTMKENPIIESPALNRAPLWDVPFPAVTFCPMVKNEIPRFAFNETNWSDSGLKFFPKNFTEPTESALASYPIFLQNILLQTGDQDNYDILRQVLPDINVEDVAWLTFPEQIGVSLQKITTPFGPCVTFNMYDEKDLLRDGVVPSSLDDFTDKKKMEQWSRDYGFAESLPLESYTYPFRAFTIDDSLWMHFSVNDSKRFSLFDSQFAVIFHAPDELPIFNRHAVFISIKSEGESFIEITQLLVEPEGIENYDPNVRRCYYNHERNLKYYRTYTQNHCESECLADYVLFKCGCVPYLLPHFNDTKICGTDLTCYWTALRKLYLPEIKNGTAHALIDDCNCLPTCTQLSYSLHVTELARNAGSSGNELQIRNKRPLFMKNVRTELHSLSEFFSNCGGSLGLLLGVSTFSIIELIYFCTIRLYLHSKRSYREKSSEKSNETVK